MKARPSNKRLFGQLCEDQAHQTLLLLLLNAEERCLSRGQVLLRFMELQEKIMEFLQDHNQRLHEQLTDAFSIKTAYFADTFSLYNATNKRMQGPESNVMQCKDALEALVCKLEHRIKKKNVKRRLEDELRDLQADSVSKNFFHKHGY